MRCMTPQDDNTQNSPVSGDDALEHAQPASPGKTGTAPGSDDADFVDAEVLPAGRQSAPLRRGTAKQRVRGHETRRRLIELHVHEGLRLKECARRMGISYGRTLAVWHAIVAEVKGTKGTPEEHQQDVFAYLDLQYRHVVHECEPRIRQGASYAAAVIAACKALAELHDLNGNKAVAPVTTLEDVGREVRTVSPLLLAHLEQVKKLTGKQGTGGDGESQTPGVAMDGVPAEGSTEGADSSAGAPSPLIDFTVSKQLISQMEQIGEKTVRRAELDGAEVAMNSIPAVRISK